MSADRRRKDRDWSPAEEDGSIPTWERVNLAVLMDLRDELKKLNTLMHCHNTMAIPELLRGIKRNTHNLPKAKPRKVKS